jgi:hypothetical protein
MDQIFLSLFLLAVSVLGYLLYRYLTLKATVEQRVRELFEHRVASSKSVPRRLAHWSYHPE